MPDKGHMETEALLRALEKRIAAEYRKANREITRKVNAYMSEFKRKDKEWREKLENGDITEAEYKAWQTGQVMIGKRWEEMRHTLAQDYANTNDLAKQMAFDSMPDVYALNHNYATFEAEKGGKVDTSYTLYDRPTVERLIRDDPKLLPDPRPGSPLAQKLAKHKELRWEEQHVQSVVLQSILQGESLEQTAKRFTQLTEMNYRQSVRYARTATTGAQNAGRVDGYKRAEKLGVDLVKQWVAALDNRTRHEHRLLDGQTQPLDKPFICEGVEIEYPGKVIEQTHLLYNCRCTVIAKVKGVDFNVSDKTQRDDKIGNMSYEEWKGDKQKAPKPPENVPKVKADKPAKAEYVEEKIPEKPKKLVFTPAKTKEEAVEYAHNFANNVNLDGVSRSHTNKINKTLTELTEKYPIKKLDKITGKERKAVMSASYDTLNINGNSLGKLLDEAEKNFTRMQESNGLSIDMINMHWQGKVKPPYIQRQIKQLENELEFKRWAVFSSYDDKVKVSVIHEYGHIIADQYFGQINDKKANPNYATNPKIREMRQKWDNVFQKAIDTGDIHSLSRYGRSNSHEFFAESFAAREMGEKLPDYVESLMKEVLDNGIM